MSRGRVDGAAAWWLLTGYAVVAAVAGDRGLPSVCLWNRVVGRRCPACGLSRSVAHLARGRLRQSLESHALGLPLVTVLATRAALRAAGAVGR